MKEIVIISGKGGTGKTSITGAFAALAQNAVLADCDVDAADLHLILKPEILEIHDFSGGKQASVNPELCTGCGKCESVCRFGAVSEQPATDGSAPPVYRVDPIACEGCGVCAWFCMPRAMRFEDQVNGQWFVSQTRFGPMVHARLRVAEENSGKLVTLVRKQARNLAETQGRDLILVDGSPGIGCPVIASITGADQVLIVTEPTVAGEHDLDRVADLIRHFEIPGLVCVNKADINREIANRIKARVEERGKNQPLSFAGEIPFNKAMTAAQIQGVTVIEHGEGILVERIHGIWERLQSAL